MGLQAMNNPQGVGTVSFNKGATWCLVLTACFLKRPRNTGVHQQWFGVQLTKLQPQAPRNETKSQKRPVLKIASFPPRHGRCARGTAEDENFAFFVPKLLLDSSGLIGRLCTSSLEDERKGFPASQESTESLRPRTARDHRNGMGIHDYSLHKTHKHMFYNPLAGQVAKESKQ